MIVDLRTYTMVPGRLGAWLKLYQAEGMPIHVRHLGQPIGVFTTDVGTVNQVVFLWGFESQADRERRRDALESDPDWVAYRQKSADAEAADLRRKALDQEDDGGLGGAVDGEAGLDRDRAHRGAGDQTTPPWSIMMRPNAWKK